MIAYITDQIQVVNTTEDQRIDRRLNVRALLGLRKHYTQLLGQLEEVTK